VADIFRLMASFLIVAFVSLAGFAQDKPLPESVKPFFNTQPYWCGIGSVITVDSPGHCIAHLTSKNTAESGRIAELTGEVSYHSPGIVSKQGMVSRQIRFYYYTPSYPDGTGIFEYTSVSNPIICPSGFDLKLINDTGFVPQSESEFVCVPQIKSYEDEKCELEEGKKFFLLQAAIIFLHLFVVMVVYSRNMYPIQKLPRLL